MNEEGFDQNEKLTIWEPKNIFEAKTYLKILSAGKIEFEWYYDGKVQKPENLYHLTYDKTSGKMETETNVDWYKPKFDISLGQPALMILG